jgi:hypothetical protein
MREVFGARLEKGFAKCLLSLLFSLRPPLLPILLRLPTKQRLPMPSL